MVSDNMFGKFSLFFCLFFVPLLHINAQTNAAPGQTRPALQILDSTKEQDGLVGSVRRVKTEYSKITIKDGSPIEGPRQLLEVTTYGVKGNRVENVSYPINDSAVGREEYKYDDHGNIIEKVLRDHTGAVLSREAYDYVFDDVGNWTKMVTSLVVIENGELKREPTEITYRTLTYYAVDSIPRATARAATGGAAVKPVAELISNQSEKPADSVVNGAMSSDAAKVDETPGSPGSGSAAVDKKEERTNGAANGTLSQPLVETRARVVAPVAETSNTSGDSSTEKSSGAKEERPEVVESEPGPFKTAKKAKTEVNASSLASVGQAEPRREGEAEKQVSSNNRQRASEDVAPPVNANASTVTGDAPEPRTASLNPSSSSAPGSDSTKPEGAESTYATNTATLTKALEFYRLGRQRFEAGDVSSAITAYLESIHLEPNSAEIHLNLGHAYLTSKKDRDAAKAFKESVRLNPALTEAYYGLGFVSFRLTRYKEAMEAFKKATELAPDLAKAHYGLALAYQELGKLDLLIQEHRLLQRLDPKLANKLVQAFSDVDFSCRQSGTRYCR